MRMMSLSGGAGLVQLRDQRYFTTRAKHGSVIISDIENGLTSGAVVSCRIPLRSASQEGGVATQEFQNCW